MSELEKYRTIVDKALKKELTKMKNRQLPLTLYRAMAYAVLNGGKRIRPILCIATYKAIRAKNNTTQAETIREILPFACGLEFVHTFSLIQDDLPSMDNDDFRRGKESLHKRYGEATALLTADVLFAYAFELFTQGKVADAIKVKTINELARICGATGLAGGQFRDLREKERPKISVKNHTITSAQKTARLISGSMKIGALVANANDKLLKQIEKIGLMLGLLFQATDDKIDMDKRISAYLTRKIPGQAAKIKALFKTLGESFYPFIDFTDYIVNRKQ